MIGALIIGGELMARMPEVNENVKKPVREGRPTGVGKFSGTSECGGVSKMLHTPIFQNS